MLTENIIAHQVHTKSKIDPLADGISAIELIHVIGNDLSIVNAARVSYGKISTEINERDRGLIRYLTKHEHTSPFEHNQLSFRIKAPLFVARQWMRHRMNSYNEVSYRYVKAPLEFYIPAYWRHQDATNRQCSSGSFNNQEMLENYKKSIDLARATYEQLLAAGVARELARGVLPLCTYTEFILTCNLRSLMHFLHLRLGHGAQHEIKVYAQGLYELALPHFPIALEEWKRKYSF